MNSYRERFKIDLERGKQYQDFIMDDLLKTHGLIVQCYSSRAAQLKYGEGPGLFEIKHDNWFARTGRFFIEVKERVEPPEPYKPAGIYHKCETLIIGDYREYFMFPAQLLRLYFEFMLGSKAHENRTKTAKGFYYYRDWAEATGRHFYPGVKTIDLEPHLLAKSREEAVRLIENIIKEQKASAQGSLGI